VTYYPELDNLGLAELVQRFHGPPLEGEEYADVYYQEVALHIREHEEAGAAFLFQDLENEDEHRLRAVLLALTVPAFEPVRVGNILRSYLQDRRPMIVAEAIDGLSRLGMRDVREQVATFGGHPSPYVRGAVLRYMGRLFPDVAKPMLLEALHDPHYIVRENAVDELDDLAAVNALPAIRPLLADAHAHARQAAETAVANLQCLAEEDTRGV
jgi:HEAT repeat protein